MVAYAKIEDWFAQAVPWTMEEKPIARVLFTLHLMESAGEATCATLQSRLGSLGRPQPDFWAVRDFWISCCVSFARLPVMEVSQHHFVDSETEQEPTLPLDVRQQLLAGRLVNTAPFLVAYPHYQRSFLQLLLQHVAAGAFVGELPPAALAYLALDDDRPMHIYQTVTWGQDRHQLRKLIRAALQALVARKGQLDGSACRVTLRLFQRIGARCRMEVQGVALARLLVQCALAASDGAAADASDGPAAAAFHPIICLDLALRAVQLLQPDAAPGLGEVEPAALDQLWQQEHPADDADAGEPAAGGAGAGAVVGGPPAAPAGAAGVGAAGVGVGAGGALVAAGGLAGGGAAAAPPTFFGESPLWHAVAPARAWGTEPLFGRSAGPTHAALLQAATLARARTWRRRGYIVAARAAALAK